jgi:hypothetical protein
MYIDLHAVKSVMYIDLHAVRFNLQTESIIDGAMCIAPYARQVLEPYRSEPLGRTTRGTIVCITIGQEIPTSGGQSTDNITVYFC